jgi:Dehydrogenases with different specificities (related to short-chain alcohol dehydrogenases)
MTRSEEPRVAIVTGAAGGVGRAVVRLLVERGHRVVAQDLSPAVAELAEPGRVVGVQADAALSGSAQATVERALAEFGRLDLLVNNAARFLLKPFAESTEAEWDELMAVNARGPFVHAKAAMPHLEATRGAIVNVASAAGWAGAAGEAVYGSTKGAVIQLTRMLAVEYGPRGVRVNAVAPGIIDTDFFRPALQTDDPATELADFIALHPLGRMTTADEVARAIAFLGSSDASAITGAILPVDGGFVAQ